MTIYANGTEAVGAAPAPEVATSPDTTCFPYNGQLAFASRNLVRHLRLSPVLAPTVAALAGLGVGA